MNPGLMVWADLRRTLVASLGVLVLLTLAFAATLGLSLTERAFRQAGAASASDFDLVVGAAGSRLDLVLTAVYLRTDEVLPLLDGALVEALEHDPRVALSSPLIFADHYLDFPIVGIGAQLPALRPSLKLVEGHWPRAPFETVAGASTGLGLGATFFGSHGVARREGVDEEEHKQAAYEVVGRLAPTQTPWDRALLTPHESLWILHGKLDPDADEQEKALLNRVSALLVKPRDFASAYALRAQYREGATTAAFPGEVLAGLFGLFDQLKAGLAWVSLGFQALVFVAVLLSLLASLPSKARWIGLLRALGAGPGYVFLTLWLQSGLVFVLAGGLGALLGTATASALSAWISASTGLSLAPAWSATEAAVLGLFGLAGLLGALVPAAVGYRTSVRRSLLGQ